MALNLKNREVEQLAAEVARLAGESKIEAIRRSLLERRERLVFQLRDQRQAGSFLRYLEHEVWPKVDPSLLGRSLTKHEMEAILGYGRDGV
jgi:antitoxin VapB